MSKLISVVIPCRNEVHSIQACIDSIYSSNYDRLEVIVVDGMSDDGTVDVLEELKKKYSSLIIIENTMKFTPNAFNLGVKHSSGSYVQIVGSRNILDPNYIPSLAKTLDSDPCIACAGGKYSHTYNNSIGKYIAKAMESPFGVGSSNYRTKTESQFVDTAGVPMFRTSIFEEIGYFKESLIRNQDDDFSYRIIKSGKKIYLNVDAKCTYLVRSSLVKLSRQMSQYGYYKVLVNKMHNSVTTTRQLVPPLFVLFLILFPFLIFFISSLKYVYLFTLTLYLLLGVISAFKQNKELRGAFITFISMFVMHVSYGLGYLRGFFHFFILGRNSSSDYMKKQTT